MFVALSAAHITSDRQTTLALVHQGKAKDSGWGSDDEAAGLPDTEAEEAPAPAPKKAAGKQVASAFDLLQGSDAEAEQPDHDSDAELSDAASQPESGADSDEGSELGEQVMSYPVHAYCI